MQPFSHRDLDRGGQLVTCGDFAIQIGAYPETIKDTMLHETGVPDLFLLPGALFDLKAGITSAELEFPLYYNYYVKRRRVRFVCRKHQLYPILRVLREALFGPHTLHHHLEYSQGVDTPGYPDLAAEMAWFKKDPRLKRGKLQLRDCVQALLLDENGQIEIDGVRITDLGGDSYRFERDGQELRLDYEGCVPSLECSTDYGQQPFKPPQFGITVIGTGHGFDVTSTTSGFILWVNGRGVLVDPPVNSTNWLLQQGINHRLIDDIILTHCHADHDSGTLQKILQEGRINLHTTETVLDSFVRKYRALTGVSQEQFLRLFNFSPVLIDQGVNIAGAEFRFKYRLHPIPTLGFETFFQGKSFVYSSDTLYEPSFVRSMLKDGILSQSRADDLLDFPWYHSLVLHEAGVPPVHTPIERLAELPDSVKERLYVIHISSKDVPAQSGLRLAPSGAADSIKLEVPENEMERAHQALDLLAHIDLFSDLRVDKAVEFLRITRHTSHSPGDAIIRVGEPGDYFYMVLSGEAEVRDQGKLLKTYSRYDYFGELALIENRPRSVDIVAKTSLELLSIARTDFLCFIRGTDLPVLFRQLARNHLQVRSEIFEVNPILSKLSSYQRTQLLSKMTLMSAPAGQVLFKEGQEASEFYLIADGLILLGQAELGPGSVLGSLGRDLNVGRHPCEARTLSECRLYRVSAEAMQAFFRANPGVYLRILSTMESGSSSF